MISMLISYVLLTSFAVPSLASSPTSFPTYLTNEICQEAIINVTNSCRVCLSQGCTFCRSSTESSCYNSSNYAESLCTNGNIYSGSSSSCNSGKSSKNTNFVTLLITVLVVGIVVFIVITGFMLLKKSAIRDVTPITYDEMNLHAQAQVDTVDNYHAHPATVIVNHPEYEHYAASQKYVAEATQEANIDPLIDHYNKLTSPKGPAVGVWN